MGAVRKIAVRYLFSGKSGTVVSRISRIGAAGIAVGVAALVVVLSVFNGFSALIEDNISQTCPYYVVRPVGGGHFVISDAEMDSLASLNGVYNVQRVVERTVGVRYAQTQGTAVLKGLQDAGALSVSAHLAGDLGIRTTFLTPLEIFYPKVQSRPGIASLASSLNTYAGRPASIVDMPGGTVIVPIQRARDLFGMAGGEGDYLMVDCAPIGPTPSKAQIRSVVGEDFAVLDRVEQVPELYKIMRVEKLAIFLILFFIILVVSLNVYASMSMLIMEKQRDIVTLRAMGMPSKKIRGVFELETLLVTGTGVLAGLAVGLAVAFAQRQFGLVRMPGNAIVDVYPIVVSFKDLIFTVLGVGLIGTAVAGISVKTISI